MSEGEAMRRLPIESQEPVVVFAWTRLALAALAAVAVVVLGFPHGGDLAAVVAATVAWSAANLAYARASPQGALHPLIAAGDMATLLAIEVAAPASYEAVRIVALALLAVHAVFQGARVGGAMAAVAVPALVIGTAIAGAGEVEGGLLVFYESVFAAAALAMVVLVGYLRTSESASRLRARELTRRAFTDERDIRRRVSESLHDGPVQEMIGLDMTLAAAVREAEREEAPATARLIAEAVGATRRNIESLRDEMLDLGPYAYEEFSYEVAVERCAPIWERRHGMETRLEIERVEIPSDLEGELFRITQEAVQNAARHGGACRVTVSLNADPEAITLSVADDGRGFGDVDPLGATEPGHIGLASIRARTELMDGELRIESDEAGSSVTVTVPLRRPASPAE